ncbi:hypothetical protein Y032_0437g1459 [Ancylostoma ceylanicum]|uniref:Uncharacterized protein n=1 Tax=Ancylostoma ceylanicum TaxID=53326 RepID=A0A016WZR5_9BILA|nr:hypothetical protein Y032_0437g1459 [Ancylostoma ceylanicum]
MTEEERKKEYELRQVVKERNAGKPFREKVCNDMDYHLKKFLANCEKTFGLKKSNEFSLPFHSRQNEPCHKFEYS